MKDFATHLFNTAVAINRARAAELQAEAGHTRPAQTHWIEHNAERFIDLQQALCGQYVKPDDFSTEPSCATCQDRMLAIERWAC